MVVPELHYQMLFVATPYREVYSEIGILKLDLEHSLAPPSRLMQGDLIFLYFNPPVPTLAEHGIP